MFSLPRKIEFDNRRGVKRIIFFNNRYRLLNSIPMLVGLAGFTVASLGAGSCFAADWGYDGDPPPVKEQPPASAPQKWTEDGPERRTPGHTFRSRDTHHDLEELRAKPQTLELPEAPDAKSKSGGKSGEKTGGKTGGKSNEKPARTAPGSTSKNPMDVDANQDGVGALDQSAEVAIPESGEAESTASAKDSASSSVPRTEAIKYWLELIGLSAPLSDPNDLPRYPDFSKALTSDQQERFAQTLSEMLAGPQKSDVDSILGFWKAVKPKLKNEEQRANYRHLFRALLRLRVNNAVASPAEKEMIMEGLGPQRMAVEEGPVPFSEDAVNAYTDMAMFLFECGNPGKDINTDQNRELFSKVVRSRFNEAPSDADRAAMNNFPLNWAKFRIVYTDADEAGKKALETAITREKGMAGIAPKNPTLDAVLNASPWVTLIAKGQKPAKPAAAQQKPPVPHKQAPAKGAPAKKKSASR